MRIPAIQMPGAPTDARHAAMTTILLIAGACTGTEPVLPGPDLAYALRAFTLAPDHLAVAHGDQIGRCNDSDAHQPCHAYTADAELDLAVCDRTTTCDRYAELRGWILIDDLLGDQLSIAANCEPEKPFITSGPSVRTGGVRLRHPDQSIERTRNRPRPGLQKLEDQRLRFDLDRRAHHRTVGSPSFWTPTAPPRPRRHRPRHHPPLHGAGASNLAAADSKAKRFVAIARALFRRVKTLQDPEGVPR